MAAALGDEWMDLQHCLQCEGASPESGSCSAKRCPHPPALRSQPVVSPGVLAGFLASSQHRGAPDQDNTQDANLVLDLEFVGPW
ncbi:hypothetical protein TREES_T100018495 [Tupaia chinensis]|uniref:Uncharacterized protein n=1 Tax=Tupaia chinensis TaxID=246437 RepID=L9KXJ7_TUPCH|nr:hypothetical protein TREES_T100018495 [Tupaia chinensis]